MTKQELISAWDFIEREKGIVYIRFGPLKPISKDEYHKTRLKIESAYLKLNRNVSCNSFVTLNLDLRLIDSESGWPEFDLYEKWSKFLEEFGLYKFLKDFRLNEDNLDPNLFSKSRKGLEKELTDELKGKEVIGLISDIRRDNPKLDGRYLLGIKVKD